jgi:hypothetical protein
MGAHEILRKNGVAGCKQHTGKSAGLSPRGMTPLRRINSHAGKLK